MRRVLTYGTFDLLHIGHLRLLERLARLGDELIVGVSTDTFNAMKGKRCIVPFEDRQALVGALRCVGRTFAEETWAQKPTDIRRFAIDVFGMGSDWTNKFDELRTHCDVVYLPRTDGVSTTLIRQTVSERTVTTTVVTETKLD